MFVTFLCSKYLKNIKCMCVALNIIDSPNRVLILHLFLNFSFRFSSVHPSLCLRSFFVHPIVIGTDLQRIYNGTTTDSHRVDISLLNNEIYRFLLYDYLHWVGRCVDIRECMAVDADRCVLWDFYRDIVASVWKNHFVVQNLST